MASNLPGAGERTAVDKGGVATGDGEGDTHLEEGQP